MAVLTPTVIIGREPCPRRPVHHRREDRIRGHIHLCWLALLLIRVAENTTDDTWRTLRHELDRRALVTLATSHGTVDQHSQTTPGQRAILGGARKPTDISVCSPDQRMAQTDPSWPTNPQTRSPPSGRPAPSSPAPASP
jgi:hypothetical protein